MIGYAAAIASHSLPQPQLGLNRQDTKSPKRLMLRWSKPQTFPDSSDLWLLFMNKSDNTLSIAALCPYIGPCYPRQNIRLNRVNRSNRLLQQRCSFKSSTGEAFQWINDRHRPAPINRIRMPCGTLVARHQTLSTKPRVDTLEKRDFITWRILQLTGDSAICPATLRGFPKSSPWFVWIYWVIVIQVWDIKLGTDRQVGDAPVGEIVVFHGPWSKHWNCVL